MNTAETIPKGRSKFMNFRNIMDTIHTLKTGKFMLSLLNHSKKTQLNELLVE
jgi:hypothetical protein